MKRVMAFVLAGGRTKELSVLSHPRSVAAVPFGGKFRLIDFSLSNCVNSEINSVAILAQYAPLSLASYVGRGEPWDLNRRDGGVTILQPYARQEGARWYEGTADALRQNQDVLRNPGVDRVFVLSSDVVYKMDYSWMLQTHLETGAAATIAIGHVPYGEIQRFGMVKVGEEGHILDFQEKPQESEARSAFMGVYLFEKDYLLQILEESDGPNLNLDVLLPRIRRGENVRAYHYEGYWEDVGAIPLYFRAHQRLLGPDPAPDLNDPGWPIYARSVEMSPVLLHETAEVTESLISNGAVIEGRVERSVISPGVHVGPRAVVREAVLMGGTVVGPGAVVERAIVDKNVMIGSQAHVGDLHGEPGEGDPSLAGISVLGKWARVSDGARVPGGSVVPPQRPMAQDAMGPELEVLRP